MPAARKWMLRKRSQHIDRSGATLFGNSQKLFGRSIEPSCNYCEHGRAMRGQDLILCDKKGVVAPYYSCKKFMYAPLKRVPKPRPKPMDFDPDDFKL